MAVARVFLDTSALFAGVWSESGGARLLLKLGEARAIRILVSPQVLQEAEGALRRKAPEALALFTVLLDRTGAEVVQSAPPGEASEYLKRTGHPGDAQVIADAAGAQADFLVTLDKEHLLSNSPLRKALGFRLGTPGDFLEWFRRRLGT